MKRYNVYATISLSLFATVEAETEEEARDKAYELGLPRIHGDQRPLPTDWQPVNDLDGIPTVDEVTEET